MSDILLTRGADGLARRGFDLDEIRRMLEIGVLDAAEKFELIDGEIVPMSPQNMPHIQWRGRIVKWLNSHVSAPLEVAPEATLTLTRRPGRTFETDILVYRPSVGMDAIMPKDVLLAIEIADTTREKDLVIKAPRYATFGVTELWVIDLYGRMTHIHREPGPGGYGKIEQVTFDGPLDMLFDPALTLTLRDIAP